jgi:argininosuccinate lyase
MKLWGGRFSAGLDEAAANLNTSLAFDWRLAAVDIQASMAWAAALNRAGILSDVETGQITAGLQRVLSEIGAGRFVHMQSDEDVHTAVERRLTEIVGPVGGKLHTGRSRNDQVATDFRLWTMNAITQVQNWIILLQSALLDRAEQDSGILAPGYTHLQRAQPIQLSHFWLAHFWPLQRDFQRFSELYNRTSSLPLGSGALAGAPFGINRQAIADDLGFLSVAQNSIDAVSDRDFAVEFLFQAALTSVHLSRLAEMLILYSTVEFDFIELSDTYTTGSSLMPQKKNPDTLELTRAKAGVLIGRLTGMLAVLKGLPSAYDKDLQEDKEPVFDAFDILHKVLPVMAGIITTLLVHPQKLQAALDPAMLATDLADYLVRKGTPFREAHHLVGRVVRRAAEIGVCINQLSTAEFQAISSKFDADVSGVFNMEASIASRSTTGGTAPEQLQCQIKIIKNIIEQEKTHVHKASC